MGKSTILRALDLIYANIISRLVSSKKKLAQLEYDDGHGNWVENEDLKNMPVFVNYGVNRSVFDVPLRISKKEKFTKLSAFDKAIESKIDFRTLFMWFRNQEDIEKSRRDSR